MEKTLSKIRSALKMPSLLLALLLCVSCLQPPSSPFQKTGLLKHNGESAEEILLRAHAHDPAAVALVLMGYQRGLGGFPQSDLLASAWRLYAGQSGLKEAAHLAALIGGVDEGLHQLSGDPEQDGHGGLNDKPRWIGSMLRRSCPKATAGSLAGAFQAAGLFDARRICAELERSAAGVPDRLLWPDDLEAFSVDILDMQDHNHAALAHSYKAGGDEAEKALERFLLGDLLAGEEHGLYTVAEAAGVGLADRDDLALLSGFLLSEPGSGYAKPAWSAWAERRLADLLAARSDPGPQLELARRAHGGDARTMRGLAVNYLNGSNGFPRSKWLGRNWAFLGAANGDAVCMLLNALQYNSVDSSGPAWAWAYLAHEHGDGRIKELAAGLMAAVEAGTSSEERRKNLDYLRALSTKFHFDR